MLHIPSYNAGLAAGTVAKALGQELPPSVDEIPGISKIMKRGTERFFFPLSFAEGYGDAFRHPERRFSALPSDPPVGAMPDGSEPEPPAKPDFGRERRLDPHAPWSVIYQRALDRVSQ